MAWITVNILILRKGMAGILQAQVLNFGHLEMHTKRHRRSKAKTCAVDDDICIWTNKFNLIKRENAFWFSIKGDGNESSFHTLKSEMEKKEENPEEVPFIESAHLFIQKSEDETTNDTPFPKATDKGVKLKEVQVIAALPEAGRYFFKLVGNSKTELLNMS